MTVSWVSERLWNWASLVDELTLEQAGRTSRLTDPDGRALIAGHVALMPDCHYGLGSTVGSVIPTENVILPSAVGVDIGCGMIAMELGLTADYLPGSMDGYLDQTRRDIPAGMGQGWALNLKGLEWLQAHRPPGEFSQRQVDRAASQFGSLGSGNHFYEVCLDERDVIWLVLHSGSRGIGNELAQIHIEKARRLMEDAGVVLEDPDLAYLTQGTDEFNAYIADMTWAQDYAAANRREMMNNAYRGFLGFLGLYWEGPFAPFHGAPINCHHNYTTQEYHMGRLLWITRKGAISAKQGELGVIPGSMGACSYIVEGLGNLRSYHSSSHGAGRTMSRTKATKTISAEDLRADMAGKSWQSGDAEYLVDESPRAYKPIDTVMADQADLTRVVHTLHSVFNYKGVERSKRSRSRVQ